MLLVSLTQVCVSAYNLCGATYHENKPLAETLLPFYAEVRPWDLQSVKMSDFIFKRCT